MGGVGGGVVVGVFHTSGWVGFGPGGIALPPMELLQ